MVRRSDSRISGSASRSCSSSFGILADRFAASTSPSYGAIMRNFVGGELRSSSSLRAMSDRRSLSGGNAICRSPAWPIPSAGPLLPSVSVGDHWFNFLDHRSGVVDSRLYEKDTERVNPSETLDNYPVSSSLIGRGSFASPTTRAMPRTIRPMPFCSPLCRGTKEAPS